MIEASAKLDDLLTSLLGLVALASIQSILE
jgi:hypothetical protein